MLSIQACLRTYVRPCLYIVTRQSPVGRVDLKRAHALAAECDMTLDMLTEMVAAEQLRHPQGDNVLDKAYYRMVSMTWNLPEATV